MGVSGGFVTSFVLRMSFVRTRVGCWRKALLLPSQQTVTGNDGLCWLLPAANSWLVQELLEAARWYTMWKSIRVCALAGVSIFM